MGIVRAIAIGTPCQYRHDPRLHEVEAGEERGDAVPAARDVGNARALPCRHRAGRVFTVAASDNPTSLWQIPRMGCVEVAVLHRNSLFGPRFHTAQVPRHQ